MVDRGKIETGSFVTIRKFKQDYEYMVVRMTADSVLGLSVLEKEHPYARGPKVMRAYGNKVVVLTKHLITVRYDMIRSVKARLANDLLQQILCNYGEQDNLSRLQEALFQGMSARRVLDSLSGKVYEAYYGNKRQCTGLFVLVDKARNIYLRLICDPEAFIDPNEHGICDISGNVRVLTRSYYDIQPEDIISEKNVLSQSDLAMILIEYYGFLKRIKKGSQKAAGTDIGVTSMVSGGLASSK